MLIFKWFDSVGWGPLAYSKQYKDEIGEAMMDGVNDGIAKHKFSKAADPFAGAGGVSNANVFVGRYAIKVRKHRRKTDFFGYISSDKISYIYAKKNVEGLRR